MDRDWGDTTLKHLDGIAAGDYRNGCVCLTCSDGHGSPEWLEYLPGSIRVRHAHTHMGTKLATLIHLPSAARCYYRRGCFYLYVVIGYYVCVCCGSNLIK
jgi:hypothetical protein